jgi:hypothetical protein
LPETESGFRPLCSAPIAAFSSGAYRWTQRQIVDVVHMQAPFRHQFLDVSVAEAESQIPD